MTPALLLLLFPIAHALTRPDAHLTPGATVSVPLSELCKPGYTARVRHVTEAMKRKVCARYGIKAGCPGPRFEIDHEISIELGGSNAIENLFPQPIAEARLKDVDENRLHREVCHGRMSLKEAQHELVQKWGGK